MEDYIVRIYRRKKENGGLFGVVEEVGIEGRKAFRSMTEHLRILRGDVLEERREAERIRLAIPATVDVKDGSDRPFSEETVIEEPSPRGAGFRWKARVLEGAPLQLRFVNDAVFTFENGDMLYSTLDPNFESDPGKVSYSCLGPVPAVTHMVITGGTGKFEGASGLFTGTFIGMPIGPPYHAPGAFFAETGTIEGWIER